MASHHFVPPDSLRGDRFILNEEESSHLTKVLRKKAGDEVRLFDGRGRTYQGRLEKLTDRRVEGRVLFSEETAPKPLRLRLLQGFPKGDRFDWILQKMTELGVEEIIPVHMIRCVARVPVNRQELRLDRWKKVVMAAAKQSGQTRLPRLWPPKALSEVLDRCVGDDLILMPWEQEKRVTLKEVLRSHTWTAKSAGESPWVSVIIGPEGGLAPEEVEMAKNRGAVTVSLGNVVLRTETAGFFVASALYYELMSNL